MSEPSAPGRLERDLARMLLTFFAVAAIDLVVVSLLTGQLRLWFPVWIDPEWATRPDPWVVYSQSYFAGIAFIPFVLWSVDRDLLRDRVSAAVRALGWVLGLLVFGFILWWKGGLMVEHHKHFEALGWLALALLLWTLQLAAEGLPRRLARLGRRGLMRGVVLGVSLFFLVMAVVDPVVQIGVQGLGWSSGLVIEVAFFVPAGIALLVLARRLRPSLAEARE